MDRKHRDHSVGSHNDRNGSDPDSQHLGLRLVVLTFGVNSV